MNAYVYQVALICEDCAKPLLAARLADDIENGDDYSADPCRDSDCCPQGPLLDGGGEADGPQHCDHCGVFLKNPLTEDGKKFVKVAMDLSYSWREAGAVHRTLCEWRKFYSYLFR